MSTGACSERRGAIGAVALGRAGADEVEALDAHLRSCAACSDELERLRGAASVLDVATPPAERGARGVARRPVVLAAAAALLVVAGAAWVLAGNGGGELEGTPIVFTETLPGAEGRAVVAGSPSGSLIDVEASGLEPRSVYALWLSDADGARVPAGTFEVDDDGEVDVRLRCDMAAADADRVWATDGEGDVALDGWR